MEKDLKERVEETLKKLDLGRIEESDREALISLIHEREKAVAEEMVKAATKAFPDCDNPRPLDHCCSCCDVWRKDTKVAIREAAKKYL